MVNVQSTSAFNFRFLTGRCGCSEGLDALKLFHEHEQPSLLVLRYILFVTQLPSWSDGLYFLLGVLKKNQNAPRPSDLASCFSELVLFYF